MFPRFRILLSVVVCLAGSIALAQNAPTPTGPFAAPVTGYDGRYLDSSSTLNYQFGGFTRPRTYRARLTKVVPERNAIYMIIGSTFVRYDLSTFADRAGTEALQQIITRPFGGELYLGFNDWVDAERSPGWSVVAVDGQDRLMDFDTDDRGLSYLAYSTFGFGIVDENLDLVAQLTAATIGFQPHIIFSFRSGTSYYVFVGDVSLDAQAIYDVTNPAAPVLFKSSGPFVWRWAKTTNGHIAIITSPNRLDIHTADTLLNGNPPIQTIARTTGLTYGDVTSDGTRFFAVESGASGLLHTLTPSGAGFSDATIPVVAPSFGTIVDYGAGHLTVTRSAATAIYDVSTGAPVFMSELALDYFTDNRLPFSVLPLFSGGQPILIVANNGVGDVFTLAPPSPLTVSQTFAPSTILRNDTTQLAITITNPNATQVTTFDFNHSYPANVVNTVTAASTTCGGSLTAAAGTDSFTLSNASLGANTSCTVTLHLTSNVTGTYDNVIPAGAIVSSENTNTESTATLEVGQLLAPTIAKAFNPTAAAIGQPVRLTITLTNPNASAITGVAFVDDYPAELVNASPANAVTTCGGTVTPIVAGLTLSGGTIPASGSCTVSVDVMLTAAGPVTNTLPAGAVTSANAAPSANAATTVLGAAAGVAIPTLSEWALIALAGMLAVGAMLRMRIS